MLIFISKYHSSCFIIYTSIVFRWWRILLNVFWEENTWMECFVLAVSCHSVSVVIPIESPALTTGFTAINSYLLIKVLIFCVLHFAMYLHVYVFMTLIFICLLVIFTFRICSMSIETLSSLTCLDILAHTKYLFNEEWINKLVKRTLTFNNHKEILGGWEERERHDKEQIQQQFNSKLR